MQMWTARFLFAVVIGTTAVQSAAADPISFGLPANGAACIPFGCNVGDRYQQVYAAEDFPGVFTISAITLPYTIDRMSNQIDPALYDIRLSTTTSAVGQLSANLASNVGGDALVAFLGPLAGEVPRGAALSFTLAVPFVFDPTVGNLLLDVVKQGGVFFGDDGIYLDHSNAMGGRSSSIWRNATTGEVFGAPTGGLATIFSGQLEAAPVPEPATMLLVGGGLAGALLARRRKRNASD
jgi:hypothetical protein